MSNRADREPLNFTYLAISTRDPKFYLQIRDLEASISDYEKYYKKRGGILYCKFAPSLIVEAPSRKIW